MLRYANVGADPNAELNWQPEPDEYAIGFPLELRNGNGGVELGYLLQAATATSISASAAAISGRPASSCASRPTLCSPRGSRQSGPPYVDGLQGNGTWRIRRDDEPPLLSYFIDYDDRFDDDAARGHLGDVRDRACLHAGPARRIVAAPFNATGAAAAGASTPPPPPPPAGVHRRPLRPLRHPPPPGGCEPGQVQRGGTGECFCGRPNVVMQRSMLFGAGSRPGRQMRELELSSRDHADRPEQFVLQQ